MAKTLYILDGEYFIFDEEEKILRKVIIQGNFNITELSEKQAKEFLILTFGEKEKK